MNKQSKEATLDNFFRLPVITSQSLGSKLQGTTLYNDSLALRQKPRVQQIPLNIRRETGYLRPNHLFVVFENPNNKEGERIHKGLISKHKKSNETGTHGEFYKFEFRYMSKVGTEKLCFQISSNRKEKHPMSQLSMAQNI